MTAAPRNGIVYGGDFVADDDNNTLILKQARIYKEGNLNSKQPTVPCMTSWR
jgi:hypothetical protein